MDSRFAAIALALALTACGGPGGLTPKNVPTEPEETDTEPETDTDTVVPTDTDTTPTDTTPTTTEETKTAGGFLVGPFCDTQAILQVSCVVGCHSAINPEAGLNLESNAHLETVNQIGLFGLPLVTPGDPENSLLYTKMAGTHGIAYGDPMPPSGILQPFFVDTVEQWILDGAPDGCAEDYVEVEVTETGPHHPPGWSASEVHGLATNLQTDGDCRSCHGANLDGGTAAVSCDQCHAPGWRTDCTFCHGGAENTTGAPPEDMDNVADPSLISFPSHSEHVAGLNHPPYGCTECHTKPLDVLSPGHIFDDVTPGYGEIYYGAGLSSLATYSFGSCTNTYCHGDGRDDNGIALPALVDLGCSDCHASIDTPQFWNQMSGDHDRHLDEGIQCNECHAGVALNSTTIGNPALHVNGTVEVTAPGVVFAAGTCNGQCHDHSHNNSNW